MFTTISQSFNVMNVVRRLYFALAFVALVFLAESLLPLDLL